MFTEEQAFRKWCPFSNVANQSNRAGGNRLNEETNNRAGIPAGADCVASRCMAWEPELRTFHVARARFIEPGETFLNTDKVEERPTGRGCCGLVRRSA